jgi:hypothetical protein
MIVKLKPNTILKGYHLSNDKVYECELRKTKYEDWFVIKCDDGFVREFATFHFLTIDEIRNEKLNDLGI